MDPATLKYATTHEWIQVDGDVATIGITDFAVAQLTDLVYIELPEPGTQFNAGDEFGVVESVKAASDLYAPVSGEVSEVHESLADDLSTLSDDPFGEGWMIRLKITDASALESLMDRAAYEALYQADDH